MRRASIVVRWTFAGWHRWPDAPQHRSYLAVRHRHLFHGEARITVEHDDREIEFHDLLDVAVHATPPGRDWGARSCEVICDVIHEAIEQVWPGRPMTIGVFEDNECGASVAYNPEGAAP